jgi:NAD(P)-dependent dehydrogenase (short-subunit alcohol dehydrogenase family)
MSKPWTTADIPSQRGRHILITGANRGLGFEIACAVAAHGADLTVGVRDLAAGEAARARLLAIAPAARIDLHRVDFANLASVRDFAETVAQDPRPIDVLVNNAAAILAPQGRSADGFETHMAVNHLAPFVLTLALLGRLDAAPAARIVNTSSNGHKLTKTFALDDLGFEKTKYTPMEAYCRSKLAALLFTQALNRRLRARNAHTIAVACHPGYANTNPRLGGLGMRIATWLLAQPAAMGALPALYAATAPGVAADAYIGPGGLGELRGYPAPARRSARAQDSALAEALWKLSEKFTGESFVP